MGAAGKVIWRVTATPDDEPSGIGVSRLAKSNTNVLAVADADRATPSRRAATANGRPAGKVRRDVPAVGRDVPIAPQPAGSGQPALPC
jgi:hypothetical protein